MREKERKLLLFAGTTEGRMLAEYLSKKRIACYVSTATEYGKSLLQEEQLSDIIILAGRMNEEEIKTFLTEKKIECVVDATHPFAKIVTENIVNAKRRRPAISGVCGRRRLPVKILQVRSR